jgi:DNA-binding response OmpR family regulator
VIDKVQGLDAGPTTISPSPLPLRSCWPVSGPPCAKRFVNGEVLTASALTLDTARRTVTVAGTEVSLTKREFDLLHCLMKNKGLVVSRETLLEQVWGFDYEGETNAVDVYVRFLRGKIDEAFGLRLIQTVRGVGYVIRDE